MPLPNCLLIGAPKAATTSVCRLLSTHPDIFIVPCKETFFFTRRWDRGWMWYESLFIDAKDERWICDASTDHSLTGVYPECLPRIVSTLAVEKIIYIVRDPFAQIESHYLERASGWETKRKFNQAVLQEPHFLDACSYWRQYCAYTSYFERGQILVLLFEEFTARPIETLRRCTDFLAIPQLEWPEQEVPRERATRDKRRTWYPIYRLKRAAPAVRDAYMKLPDRPRAVIRRLIKRRFGKRPEWHPDVRRYVLRRVRPDAEAILDHLGQPHDVWPSLRD